MKKLFALIISGVMLLSLASCSKKNDANETGPLVTQAQDEDKRPITRPAPAYDAEAIKGKLTKAYKTADGNDWVYFATNDDGSYAALVFYSTVTNGYATFIGNCSKEDDKHITITDEVEGLRITVAYEPQIDNVVIDLEGEGLRFTLTPIEVDEFAAIVQNMRNVEGGIDIPGASPTATGEASPQTTGEQSTPATTGEQTPQASNDLDVVAPE